MEVTINNDSKLVLCPNLTSDKDIDNMIDRITSCRKVGIEPRDMILSHMGNDDIDSQHKVLQLLVSLALEEGVISPSDMYSDISLFVNPQSLALAKYLPGAPFIVSIHKETGDKVEFEFKTSDFINFLLQSIAMVHNDDVPSDLPNNAILFHTCSILARHNDKELNQCISNGSLHVILQDSKPSIVSSNNMAVFCASSEKVH